jgi:hypothetical protein
MMGSPFEEHSQLRVLRGMAEICQWSKIPVDCSRAGTARSWEKFISLPAMLFPGTVDRMAVSCLNRICATGELTSTARQRVLVVYDSRGKKITSLGESVDPITNDAGVSGSRKAELDPEYYQELTAAEATTVSVKFVPAEPGISRLLDGEVIDEDFTKTPTGGYGLAVMGALLSLFLVVAGVMQLKGWDIDMDSKTGKISIKRFGEGC